MSRKTKSIVVGLVCIIIGFVGGVFTGKSRGIPFVKRQWKLSIGIYSGKSPFDVAAPPNVKNPVLNPRDVRDVQAQHVADPFMVFEDGTWFMFFEVFHRKSQQDIGLATSSDGFNWTYKQIVLDEPFNLSYPYVFKWNNQYYMIPSSALNSTWIYKAVNFPTEWSRAGKLLDGGQYADPSIFCFRDKWWMFAETSTGRHDTLRLYCADNLMGPWAEHPKNPIISRDANIARPGGRVVIIDGRVFRYAQDCDPVYGNQVRAFEITKLTTTSYEEKEIDGNPVLKGSGTGWNSLGMHHIDPHQIGENQWIACVDGFKKTLVFGLKY